MRRVALLAFSWLSLGCAGWGRDHAARLRPDEDALPALTIRCDAAPAVEAMTIGVPVTVDAPSGLQPIGELFDWGRRSESNPVLPLKKRHPLVVDADAFARTVQGHVGRIFVGEPTAAARREAPLLVVRIADVRTTVPRPGWTDLRVRMVSRVALRAELRDGARVVWSRLLEGEGEKLVFYVRLVHHETTLSAAYCAALARLREAVPEIARALAPGRVGRTPGPGTPELVVQSLDRPAE